MDDRHREHVGYNLKALQRNRIAAVQMTSVFESPNDWLMFRADTELMSFKNMLDVSHCVINGRRFMIEGRVLQVS